MGSKTIIYFGLLLAMVLLISSQVAARDLAETSNTLDASTETETNEALKDVKYSGGGGNYGGGYPGRGGGGGGYPGRGGGGGGGGYPGHGGGGGRGGCRHGCCGRSYYRGGCRCCTFAGEKADADVQAKPHN